MRDQVVLINRVCYKKKQKQDKIKIHGEVVGGGGHGRKPKFE